MEEHGGSGGQETVAQGEKEAPDASVAGSTVGDVEAGEDAPGGASSRRNSHAEGNASVVEDVGSSSKSGAAPLLERSASKKASPPIKAVLSIDTVRSPEELQALIAAEKETKKYQAMIEHFDKKYIGLKPQPVVERWKLEGEEEIEGLLEEMLGTEQEKVAAAATRLRHIITGEDAAASGVRLKLIATPLAIDTICQSIINAEELWAVTYPFGVTVRAQSNQKSNRVGNLPIGTVFSVSTITLGWLKLRRPPAGYPEGWVRIGAPGKEQAIRQSDDAGKVAVMELLMTLSELRHMCLELPRRPALVATLAFVATIAPAGSSLRDTSHRLLQQLRISRTLLHAWPAAPGRRVGNSRSMHTGGSINAPELHALRTAKSRRPVTPSGTAIAAQPDREAGASALTRHQRPNSTQPEGWYGTGIHSIIAPPPVTSLRAYTSGIRLPMANLERRSKTPGGPLHVASHVSTFDWAS